MGLNDGQLSLFKCDKLYRGFIWFVNENGLKKIVNVFINKYHFSGMIFFLIRAFRTVVKIGSRSNDVGALKKFVKKLIVRKKFFLCQFFFNSIVKSHVPCRINTSKNRFN